MKESLSTPWALNRSEVRQMLEAGVFDDDESIEILAKAINKTKSASDKVYSSLVIQHLPQKAFIKLCSMINRNSKTSLLIMLHSPHVFSDAEIGLACLRAYLYYEGVSYDPPELQIPDAVLEKMTAQDAYKLIVRSYDIYRNSWKFKFNIKLAINKALPVSLTDTECARFLSQIQRIHADAAVKDLLYRVANYMYVGMTKTLVTKIIDLDVDRQKKIELFTLLLDKIHQLYGEAATDLEDLVSDEIKSLLKKLVEQLE